MMAMVPKDTVDAMVTITLRLSSPVGLAYVSNRLLQDAYTARRRQAFCPQRRTLVLIYMVYDYTSIPDLIKLAL